MSATIALNGRIPYRPERKFKLPKFEPWRILRPLALIGGNQFYPYQNTIHGLDGALTPVIGAGGFKLFDILNSLGLGANLLMCLDAGDGNSYTSGQTWADLTANGLGCFLGTTSSVESVDPIFNGTANNVSLNEYFSSTGTQMFRLNQANTTRINNLHKASEKSSAICWLYNPTTTSNSIYGTSSGNPASIGVDFVVRTTGQIQFSQRNGVSTGTSMSGTVVLTNNVWSYCAYTADAANSASGWIQTNATQENIGMTYNAPSASAASFTLEVGARGSANTPMLNGTRIAMFALWEGVALAASDLNNIFSATRGRMGV